MPCTKLVADGVFLFCRVASLLPTCLPQRWNLEAVRLVGFGSRGLRWYLLHSWVTLAICCFGPEIVCIFTVAARSLSLMLPKDVAHPFPFLRPLIVKTSCWSSLAPLNNLAMSSRHLVCGARLGTSRKHAASRCDPMILATFLATPAPAQLSLCAAR